MGIAALPNSVVWFENELSLLIEDINAIPLWVQSWVRTDAHMFQETVLNPIRSGLKISFASLSDNSAFFIDRQTSHMVFNSNQLCLVITAAETYIIAHGISEPDAGCVYRTVFRLFVLHELHHLSQGVSRFSDVSSLKSIGGDRLIARFDLLADRFAIHALGIIEASQAEDADTFMTRLRTACEMGLFVNGAIFFQAFDFSPSKPEKNRRALGITFMASRYALYQTREHWRFPNVASPALDDAIWPLCSPDFSQIAMFAFDPTERLLGIIDVRSPGHLQMLSESLGSIDFAVSIEGACKVIRDAHLIARF
jgi:hypothetical protein